jgi:hypothetical protein
VLNAAILSPRMVVAQSVDAIAVPCKGQLIQRIDIQTKPPFEVKGAGLQRRIARQLTALHSTTDTAVIDRFLALRVGMQCDELRRLESERILRAQPYLADATITPFVDRAGTFFLSVITTDETSLVLGGGGSGGNPYLRSFKLGEENLKGRALSVVGTWRYSENFRDNFSAQIIDYQFLGKPYQLMLEGQRNELGGDWAFELSHPFLSDLQRISWRSTAGSREEYRFFRRDPLEPVSVPDGEDPTGPPPGSPAVGLNRSYADIGGVIRVGPPGGRLALVGGSISYEDEMPQNFPTAVGPGTVQRDTIAELIDRYGRHKSTRLNLLAGIRDVRYLSVTGFDALDGRQDVRKGVEISTLLGHGYEALGSTVNDMFASADVYAGMGSKRLFAGFEGTLEGRRDEETKSWDGILGSSKFATYFKPAPGQTFLTTLEWSGGWRQRIPFQLLLADKTGGPRGYEKSTLGGGERLVLRLEDRFFLGHFKTLSSLGLAPFTDFGKVYAGDSPFGVTSPIVTSVGISLLASIPPKSQRMWRLDLAYPLNKEHGARLKLSLFGRDFTSVFWREPSDVRRNRERSVPTSIFNWP